MPFGISVTKFAFIKKEVQFKMNGHFDPHFGQKTKK